VSALGARELVPDVIPIAVMYRGRHCDREWKRRARPRKNAFQGSG